MNLIFNTKTSLALTIHDDYIRILQLQYKGSYHSVKKFTTMALVPGSIVDGQIKSQPAVLKSLQTGLASVGIHSGKIAITLPYQHFITTRIKLSYLLKENELAVEIQANLTRFFPGISSQLQFDFVIINRNQGAYDILLVATRTQFLREYIQLIEQVGLTVTRVESPLFANIRTVSHIFPKLQYLGVLEITPASAQFIILRQQKIVFSHFLSSASKDELIIQLQQALQSWLALDQVLPLQNIYVIGEIQSVIPLRHEIEKSCQVTLLTLDDSVQACDLSQAMMVSYGLALRDKNTPTINLLAWRENQFQQRKKFFGQLVMTALLLLGSSYVGIYFYLQLSLRQIQTQVVRLQSELASRAVKAKNIAIRHDQSLQFKLVFQQLVEQRRQLNVLINFFNKMLVVLPDEIELTQLARSTHAIDLVGVSHSGQALGDWLSSLPDAHMTKLTHARDEDAFNFKIHVPL